MDFTLSEEQVSIRDAFRRLVDEKIAPLVSEVIGFPPAKREKIRQLAIKGDGNFSFVEDETEIACAILKCLN